MKYTAILIIVCLSILTSYSQSNYGSIDTSFNSNDVGFSRYHSGDVSDLHVYPDGKILVCGAFYEFSGYSKPEFALLNPDLTINNGFGFNMNTTSMTATNGLFKFGVQSSGKIIIGGDFVATTGSSTAYRRVARLNLNGTADNSYSTGSASSAGTNGLVEDLVIQPDGKAIIVGNFTTFAGNFANHILRLGLNGGNDPTFNVGSGMTSGFGYSWLTEVAQFSDGKFIVAGYFSSWNNLAYNNIVRLKNDGSLDATFLPSSGPNGDVMAICELPNGKIAIGGDFTSYNGVSCNRFCILNNDGTLDLTYNIGIGFDGSVSSISTDASGKVYVGGNFTSYNGTSCAHFVALDGNGVINNNFIGHFDKAVNVIKPQSDGSLLIGGKFTGFENYAIRGLAKILPNGIIDTTFNRSTGTNSGLDGVTMLTPSTAIVYGYDLDAYNGTLIPSGVAKIDSSGNLISDDFSSLPLMSVYTAVLDQNDKVLVGGYSGNSSPLPSLLRTDIHGAIDVSFISGIPNVSYTPLIHDIDLSTDDKYLVTYQTGNDLFFCRLNNNGSMDNSFQTVQFSNGFVQATILPNGKALLFGSMVTINSSFSSQLTRINNDGTIDQSFTIGSGSNGTIRIVKLLPNGKLFVGGEFSTWNGINQKGYVILNSDGSVANNYTYPLNFSNQSVTGVQVLGNGKLMISGTFSNTFSTTKNVLLLFPDGTQDQNFSGYKAIANEGIGYINDLTRFDSTMYYLSGNFSSVNNIGANGVERISYTATPLSHDTVTTCDSYTWINGQTYTTSQDSIYYSVFNSAGSDSTIMLTLIINYTQDTTLAVTSCDSYFWPISNQTYYNSTTAIDTIMSSLGCDSIITLNLTILQSSSGIDTITSCDSLIWIDGITYFSSTDTPTWTLTNSVGCDSIVTLDLIILNSSTGIDLQTSCDSLTWIDGVTYYSSTDTPSWTLTNSVGCDSIVTLNLTIHNSSSGIDIQTVCDSLTWVDGITYYASTITPTWTFTNSVGCDSVVTLNLVVTDFPLIENEFSLPSSNDTCTGSFAIDIAGIPTFELIIDGAPSVISNGYSLINDLCAGVHDVQIVNSCGDTTVAQFVIPVDSNYVFNNPFIDSLAQDSLGITLSNCDIYYAGIDTAYIDSLWANGNTVNVIWNIVDSNGSNFDTTTYELNNGNGVYWLQLSVFCPTKALGEYFTVTEAIYFADGNVSSAGLSDLEENSVWLYPNPTNDQVTISFEGNAAVLTIYDAQGSLIQTSNIVSGETISLKYVETGVYFLDIQTEAGRSVKRAVKR